MVIKTDVDDDKFFEEFNSALVDRRALNENRAEAEELELITPAEDIVSFYKGKTGGGFTGD